MQAPLLSVIDVCEAVPGAAPTSSGWLVPSEGMIKRATCTKVVDAAAEDTFQYVNVFSSVAVRGVYWSFAVKFLLRAVVTLLVPHCLPWRSGKWMPASPMRPSFKNAAAQSSTCQSLDALRQTSQRTSFQYSAPSA